MEIRRYKSVDLRQISRLFYETVHAVNIKDYTKEQINAWATGRIDLKEWDASFQRHITYVVTENDLVVGFGDIDRTGYLDKLFASPLFIILFFFGKKRYASFFLALSILSCVLDVIGGMIIHGDGPRLRGLYGHPMTLAGFLLTSLPILFCFLLDWKQDRKTLFVTIMFFLIGFTGLLLNGTRGAWLALAVSLPLVAVLYDHSIKKILFLVIFAVGTSLVFFNSPQLQNRAESITSTTMQSNTERLLMWESAYEMFKDHPVFGVGIGQYASKYLNEYKSPEAKEKQNHCHNNFLQMLAENGVAGFIGFCLLFGYILLSSLKNAFFKCSPYYVLIFGSSLALLLQGFTEYNFGNSAVIKYYWATLGCLLVLAHQTENKASANSFSLFQHTKTEI